MTSRPRRFSKRSTIPHSSGSACSRTRSACTMSFAPISRRAHRISRHCIAVAGVLADTGSHAYGWLWESYHLVHGGQGDKLRQRLLDVDWVRRKLLATGPSALLADYGWIPNDPDLTFIAGAIRLSSAVLWRDPDQLASQLLAFPG
jgi:APAF-1 helical domain